jgi:hypothetical protein
MIHVKKIVHALVFNTILILSKLLIDKDRSDIHIRYSSQGFQNNKVDQVYFTLTHVLTAHHQGNKFVYNSLVNEGTHTIIIDMTK